MKRFLYITLCVLLAVLSACNKKNSTDTKSSVAKLTAFSFAKNDSMPGLAAAVFTVEERLDTGLVWDKDSILYGTELDSVVPRFVFAATPGAAYLTLPDTTCNLTGYDTLDFSVLPIYLTIRSQDGTAVKTYEIRPTVHQVDPDLYTWEELCPSIYSPDESEQRVVELGDEFIMIKNNGFALHAYTSENGTDWTDIGEPSGLPYGTKVRQIISDGTTLYYGEGNNLYSSTDGQTWTSATTPYSIYAMLLYWNNLVWALVENNGYQLATWHNNQLDTTNLRPNDFFPISDFATVCFQSASERERAMIIGGFAENGLSLNTRWNLEYSRHIPDNGGYRLQDFSIDRPSFTTLTGISVIWYNNQLLMFGGVDANMTYFGRDILISNDEGLNWSKADTTKNQLPAVYKARQKQTAIVRDDYIYLFGGQDKDATYSDVYRGRLNSINWNK